MTMNPGLCFNNLAVRLADQSHWPVDTLGDPLAGRDPHLPRLRSWQRDPRLSNTALSGVKVVISGGDLGWGAQR